MVDVSLDRHPFSADSITQEDRTASAARHTFEGKIPQAQAQNYIIT
jgi:hypothetical protein